MVKISSNFFGAALAFCIGAAIAAANYAFSRYILKKDASKYFMAQLISQPVQIAYLVALFFLGPYTPWDRIWLLAGGCSGIVALGIFAFGVLGRKETIKIINHFVRRRSNG